ncbi:hypothetical protein BVC80_1831g99 [Macleaya cordata]|uniref:Uncharacterized protein n=1 Tax=Macleaya cordata TaxID=56857 RepID=A0A200R762_MACCD|nr:hypothetical protein BVC80_1831g99 [Macleaya cordata]
MLARMKQRSNHNNVYYYSDDSDIEDESDSKKKPHKRKVSKKKTKEELEEALIKISDQNDTFKKAVEKVMEHYETLMAENLRIKSKMQELSNYRQREGLLDLNSSETGTSLDLLVEPAGPTVPSPAPEQPVELVSMMGYEQPPLVDQKPFGSEIFENSGYPYVQMPTSLPVGIGLAMAQRLGSLGIPDLNFTADHETTTATVPAATRTRMRFFQPFDLRKAVLTAEARRRRIEMTKVKKSMANAKTRLQIR